MNVLLSLSNLGGIFDSEVRLARWANGILEDARCREQVEGCCGNLGEAHLAKDGHGWEDSSTVERGNGADIFVWIRVKLYAEIRTF